MHFKKPTLPFFFRKLNKKSGLRSGGDGDVAEDSSKSWSSDKRKLTVYTWFIDGFVFKVVYVLEAVVLVFTLGFFYLCCGCHI